MVKVGSTVKGIITLIVLTALFATAAFVFPGGGGAKLQNRHGSHVWVYVTSTARRALVEYRVTSSVSGTVEQSPDGGVVSDIPFLRDYPVASGETVTVEVRASVSYNDYRDHNVVCEIRTSVTQVDHDRHRKTSDNRFPDVACEGSVTSL
jgi:hypothetical protein